MGVSTNWKGGGAPDLGAVGAAVAESCAWITALLDVMPKGRSVPLLAAIRWVRNTALHQLVVRAEKEPEGIFTIGVSVIGGPDRLPHSKWVDRAALGPPPAKPSQRWLRGAAAYDAELGGQPVLLTIRAARCLVDPTFAERVARGWS